MTTHGHGPQGAEEAQRAQREREGEREGGEQLMHANSKR
jgi:hypothetical protein